MYFALVSTFTGLAVFLPTFIGIRASTDYDQREQ
jgi:hypothetical protein